jgi:hypothetical protein
MEQIKLNTHDQDALAIAVFYKARELGYSADQAQELLNVTHAAFDQFNSYTPISKSV